VIINGIKDYINDHCTDEISLTSIAETFRLSSSHLSRLFKRVSGENIVNYIVNAKLEQAAEMLTSLPDENIKDISGKLGYFTAAYFGRLFKEKYGVTPSAYRKRYLLKTLF
jgi:two-component system response regulator YesN